LCDRKEGEGRPQHLPTPCLASLQGTAQRLVRQLFLGLTTVLLPNAPHAGGLGSPVGTLCPVGIAKSGLVRVKWVVRRSSQTRSQLLRQYAELAWFTLYL
jgi:hypothetical protein